MVGEIAATSSLMFCFKSNRCPWFLFVYLTFEISSEEEVMRLGTLVPINIEVPTKYPLSQDRIVVLKYTYVSTAKAQCCTDQHSMATEMLWVSLEERSRTNSPCHWFHSQLFRKIVRHFCRTPYYYNQLHVPKICLSLFCKVQWIISLGNYTSMCVSNTVFIDIHCNTIHSFSLYSSIYIFFRTVGVFTGNKTQHFGPYFSYSVSTLCTDVNVCSQSIKWWKLGYIH